MGIQSVGTIVLFQSTYNLFHCYFCIVNRAKFVSLSEKTDRQNSFLSYTIQLMTQQNYVQAFIIIQCQSES